MAVRDASAASSDAAGIHEVVIGTAGHIDHGKSSVVRRLTGVDPDRLPEEKSRGLTIDLGFAPLTLPGGERVGIVDVPGHERFIKNMVAGSTGIDLVLLVVAADDSVMPQTREHLDIMTLLGLQRGMIVINKIDLVESDLVDLVEEEVREIAQGTFLEDAPAFRVSAETGAGFDEFGAALHEAIYALEPRSSEGVFRMPVQRVFSVKGHGTVLTGIPVSGRAAVGDRVEVLPLGAEGRVRGVQAYRSSVDRAAAGHSTALNVADIDFHAVRRGMVVATPGFFQPTTMIEARVRVLPHLRLPLRHAMPVRFHAGTAEVVGTLYLLEGRIAEPGVETFGQFRLKEPIVVAPGDRYVFRQESPLLTLGGGEILDRSTWRLKQGKEYVLDALARKEAALGSPLEFLASAIEARPFEVVEVEDLARYVGLPIAEVRQLVETLAANEQLAPLRTGYLSERGIERAAKRVIASLEAAYTDDRFRVFVTKPEVHSRTRLPAPFFEALLPLLAERGVVDLRPGGKVSLPGRVVDLSDDERAAYELWESVHREHLFSPPRLEEVAASRGLAPRLLERVQCLLLDEGKLVRVPPDVTLHETAIDAGIEKLSGLFADTGPFTAAQAKDALGTSRKFAIPFLEYLDQRKVTQRVGDLREMVVSEGAESGS